MLDKLKILKIKFLNVVLKVDIKKIIKTHYNGVINYPNIIIDPNKWTTEFFASSVIFWAFIFELPLYILFMMNFGDIVGLFLTYCLTLAMCLIHLVLVYKYGE